MITFHRTRALGTTWTPEIESDERDTIMHVIKTYDFLMDCNREVSALEFANLIEGYTDHPKGKRCADMMRKLADASYWEQLEVPVLKYLKNYQDDFNVYDKEQLEGYTGNFIFGCRTAGTNLLRLQNEHLLNVCRPIFANGTFDPSIETFDANVKAFLFSANERFFLGRNSVVESVDKETALGYYNTCLPRIKRFFEDYKKERVA